MSEHFPRLSIERHQLTFFPTKDEKVILKGIVLAGAGKDGQAAIVDVGLDEQESRERIQKVVDNGQIPKMPTFHGPFGHEWWESEWQAPEAKPKRKGRPAPPGPPEEELFLVEPFRRETWSQPLAQSVLRYLLTLHYPKRRFARFLRPPLQVDFRAEFSADEKRYVAYAARGAWGAAVEFPGEVALAEPGLARASRLGEVILGPALAAGALLWASLDLPSDWMTFSPEVWGTVGVAAAGLMLWTARRLAGHFVVDLREAHVDSWKLAGGKVLVAGLLASCLFLALNATGSDTTTNLGGSVVKKEGRKVTVYCDATASERSFSVDAAKAQELEVGDVYSSCFYAGALGVPFRWKRGGVPSCEPQ